MNDFCMCSDMKDKNQRIHELEEKIHEYKAEIRDLYQVDISDLKKTICCLKERVEELDCENEFLTKRVEELEDDNGKLESLKQHLLNHLSNKEAEIVNLKEENEKLLNEIKYWKDKYETLDKDSTDGSYIYISIPKGQKVSNFEVHFQEENDSNVAPPASLWATVPYASGKGPVTTYGSWTVTTMEDNDGHNDSIKEDNNNA